MELTNDQIYANMALESWWNSYDSKQIFEISGKSGSGKTALVRYFIDRIGLKDDEVLFLAYAGKGAQQITVRNKVSAQTIHSAIYDYYEEYDKDLKGRLILKKNGKPKTKMVFRLKKHLPKKVKLIVDSGPKPSIYTSYLLNKYRGVIDNYNEIKKIKENSPFYYHSQTLNKNTISRSLSNKTDEE
jgi:hypothetical protein